MLTPVVMRPARLQLDPDTIDDDERPPQTGTAFNIWFLKWSGGESSNRNYIKSKYRVNVERDSGTTKASANAPICLFFARGCCYRGSKCPFLHRIPQESDYVIPTKDCFGRDKTASYRDDMDGVGSFNRVNCTLYVSGLHVDDNSESKLSKHFGEFGAIEQIKVIRQKNIAFVTYKLEESAQFAKEAMANQSLDDESVLVVKWASENPDPQSRKLQETKLQQKTYDMVKRLLDVTDPSSSSSEKKRKLQDTPKIEQEIVNEPESIQEPVSLIPPRILEELSKFKRNIPIKQTERLVDYTSDSD